MYGKRSRKIAIVLAALVALCGVAGCGRSESRKAETVTVSLTDGGGEVDSLYRQFATSTGPQAVSVANRIFDRLNVLEVTDSLVQLSTSTPAAVVRAQTDYWMGEYLLSSQRPEDALRVAQLALAEARGAGDEELSTSVNSLLSAIYMRLGLMTDAVKALEQCLAASVKAGSREDMSSDLNNLAAISTAMHQYDRAIAYINRAIEIERTLGRGDVMAVRLGIASEAYLGAGRLEEAERYAREALEIDSREGREAKAAVRRVQLAAVLKAEGEQQQALEQLELALPALEQAGNRYSMAVCLRQMAEICLERGESARAQKLYGRSLEMARESGFTTQMQADLLGLWRAYKDQDIKRASGYLEEYTALTDSINKERDNAAMTNVQSQFDISELQRENREITYRHRVTDMLWIAAGVLAMLVILALVLVIRSKNRAARAMRDMERIRSGFFANITHEFRTPLTAILGLTTDLASGRADNPDDRRQAIEIIERQSKGLLSLINQILDISRLSAHASNPRKKHSNIVGYIDMVVRNMRPLAHSKGVELVFSPSVSTIEMDFVPDYINKIVSNLLGNALKHSHRGGNVWMELHTDRHSRTLVVRVADDGEGISRKDLPHIFEPFYVGEGNEDKPSSGIGLALVNQLVQSLGGTIEAVSSKGKGAVFTVTLPIEHTVAGAGADAATVPPESMAIGPAEQGMLLPQDAAVGAAEGGDDDDDDDRPVVLVVEDNYDIAYYIGSHLREQYAVHYAPNGAEALVKARELVPDIVITDVIMPVMDGLELTRAIRADELLDHIPIIALTAKSEEADRLAGLQAGVDSYVVKPFNSDELQLRVEKLLEQRKMLQQKYSHPLAEGHFTQMPKGDTAFMQRMVDYVNRSIKSSRTVDIADCAAHLNMSTRAFARKVKALTGDTPSTYINRIKISRAKLLIDRHPEMNINEIGMECGFEGPSYFSRIFRHYEGVTPTQYRNRVR